MLHAADWSRSEEPTALLKAFGPRRRTDRKMRLVAVAACRVALGGHPRPDLEPDDVSLGERLADGQANDAERVAALRRYPTGGNGVGTALLNWSGFQAGFQVLGPLGMSGPASSWQFQMPIHLPQLPQIQLPQLPRQLPRAAVVGWGDDHPHPRSERARVCDAIRDIFGDPSAAPDFDPAWRTGTVVALARTAYDRGDFGAAPVLADALQEAGCEDPVILDHLRGPGPHVRGCWAVDLVLGRD